jgi:hypothetical protein
MYLAAASAVDTSYALFSQIRRTFPMSTFTSKEITF